MKLVTRIRRNEDNPLLGTALAYAEKGWPVLPLHSPVEGTCSCGKPDCGSVGKHPRTKHGLKDGTTDSRRIREWWRHWPDANVGIVTGAKSGFFVLDIDTGGEESLKELEKQHGPLPDTVEASTGGGGRHILLKHPGGIVKNRAKIAPGLDVRGDGGYIVAPESLHSSGKRYEWAKSPSEADLAPCPGWLFKMIQKPSGRKKAGFKSDGRLAHLKALEGVPEGMRNDTVYRCAWSLRAKGLAIEETKVLALKAGEKCDPPLSEDEVLKTVESAYKYPPKEAMQQAVKSAIKHAKTVFVLPDQSDPEVFEPFLNCTQQHQTSVAIAAPDQRDCVPEHFKNKNVIIFRGNTERAFKKVERIRPELQKHARSLKVVEIPDEDSETFTEWVQQDVPGALRDIDRKKDPRGAMTQDLVKCHLNSFLDGRIEDAIDQAPLYLPRALDRLTLPLDPFSDISLPRRQMLMEPWLMEGSITLIAADPAVGKTFLAMEVAVAVSSARAAMNGLWEVQKSVKALYVDGEMHSDDIMARAQMVGFSRNRFEVVSKTTLEYFGVTPALNLADPEVLKMLTGKLLKDGFGLLVIDNIFSLVSGIDTNSDSDWAPINGWLLHLRSKGIAVIAVHHAGKSGEQLGTSSRAFNVDNYFKLVPEPSEDGKVAFRIIIKKQRARYGGVAGYRYECDDGVWTVTESTGKQKADRKRKKIAALLVEGMKHEEIGAQVKLKRSRVSQIKKELVNKGLIENVDNQVVLTAPGRIWMGEDFQDDQVKQG